MDKKVRTRFAPSPTGFLHIGGLRAALFEYAYAKSLGGEFVLRIEDTDRNRFVPGSTEKLIETLKIFGLNWDEGPEVGGPFAPYVQSERLSSGVYKKIAERLVDEGKAYYCFCDKKTKDEIKLEHESHKIEVRDDCRNLTKDEIKKHLENGETPAIRLKVPDDGIISYHDFILDKDIVWNCKDIDEAMLFKSDGYPTYHLGVVADDVEMQITHILRGFEWMPSTPIHLLLFKYLNYEAPKIGHFSLILDPEGGKLSKRKRNVSCEDFLANGYLPEAILNYIMLQGWAPKDNNEIFSLPEYVANFQKGNLQIANAVFNPDKLDWFNGYYIRKLSDEDLNSKFQIVNSDFASLGFTKQIEITKLIKDRIVKLTDLNTFAKFFWETPEVEAALFGENYKEHLSTAISVLESMDDWKLESLNEKLMEEIKRKEYKVGEFFMTLRIAITGSKFTPPINDSIVILGKEETIKRLENVS